MATKTPDDYTVHGTVRVDEPRELPAVLDVFIAGGGPAGTAAAFRAAELGLSCLVVDYDELMSRIRDYPKEKHIYPDFADDESAFPSGERLITSLHFHEIDKDDLVVDWRSKYRSASIPAKVGSEFTGLSRGDDGIWNVKTWNHRVQEEAIYRARHVILAIGAGKPRRFAVPGNLEGISFRLDDAKRCVGGPALVIGGGTSAAEAVIAISNAKMSAADRTAVYWSYRKDQMPRIEKSLSGPFFDAYVGNGNVRYLPFSEPILVLVAPDRNEYLSVRVDWRDVAGRPPESTHLEFCKERVVACIGGDVPHLALQKLGIQVPTIDGEQFLLLTDDGESSLPGVFIVGDVRGTPEYYCCSDFTSPTTYKKRRDKRNIKMAMRDAVRAVEVIAVGAGRLARPVAVAPAAPPISLDETQVMTSVFPDELRQPEAQVRLVSLLPDGSTESAYAIKSDSTRIGRKTDGVSFDDPYMADHHASVTRAGGQYVLSDTGSGSGVWLRVAGAGCELAEDDQVWIGAQFLRVTRHDGQWNAEHYDSRGEYLKTYPCGANGIVMGRSADVTLDPKDTSLSRGHARLAVEGGSLRIVDIGSTNGTYVKITGPVVLRNGDEFRVASRRLRFESFAVEEPLRPGAIVRNMPAPAPAAAEPESAAAPLTGPVASFEDARHPVAFAVADDRDVLHGFFEYVKAKHPDTDLRKCGANKSQRCPDDHFKEPLDWSCEVGACGYCAVQIVAGADQLVPSDHSEIEKSTLENVRRVTPDLTKVRLACLTRIKGPVTFKVLPKG